jgi:hypothetical protein
MSHNLALTTPRTWHDPLATARPRRDRLRIFADTYAEHPAFDQRAWDEARNAVAAGRLTPRSPHSP